MRAAVAYYTQRRGETPQARLLAEAAEAVLEQREWAAELDRGRGWLEEQWQRWQELAEERERGIAGATGVDGRVGAGQGVAGRAGEGTGTRGAGATGRSTGTDRRVGTREQEDQGPWHGELEQGKERVVGRAAERIGRVSLRKREQVLLDARTAEGDLEQQDMVARAAGRRRHAEHWQESLWGRLGTRLKLVKPVQEFPAKTEPESRKQ